MSEKALAIDMTQSAQQTYAEGSFRLHELVIEKKGRLDPDGVKKALQIVEEMMPTVEKRDFGDGTYDWDSDELVDWVTKELIFLPSYDFENTRLHIFNTIPLTGVEKSRITKIPGGMDIDGSLNLNGCVNLKIIPAGVVIIDSLYLQRVKLKPEDISSDIKVGNAVYIDRNRDDLINFFNKLKIKVVCIDE